VATSFAELVGEIGATNSGHLQIRKDSVGCLVASGDFERSLAGLCGFNLIAFVREKKLKQLATQRVIVDYEDADRHLVEHVGKEYQRTRIVVFEAMGGRQAVH
jgi:hypothetical protein